MTDLIREQLEARVKAFSYKGIEPPLERLILDYGRTFIPQKFTGERGPARECYSNALHYALRHGLLYCEGYAMSGNLLTGGLPLVMEHAWCSDEQGNVVEITWKDGANSLYLGLMFNAQEAATRVLRKKTYGLFFTGAIGMYDLKYIEKLQQQRGIICNQKLSEGKKQKRSRGN